MLNIIVYSTFTGIVIKEIFDVITNEPPSFFTIPSQLTFFLFNFILVPIVTALTAGIGFFLMGLKNIKDRGRLLIYFSIISGITILITFYSSFLQYQLMFQGTLPTSGNSFILMISISILNHARFLMLIYFGLKKNMYFVEFGAILLIIPFWASFIMIQTMPPM